MEAVPLDDRGLLLGDGLFETILAEAGRLVLFDAHAGRLRRGCGVLGLPAPDPQALWAAAEQAIAAAGLSLERCAVRLTWTGGSGGRGLVRPDAPHPRLIATAAPAPAPAGPARLVLTSVRRNTASPTSRLKTLAYLDNVLARREAAASGADEALMLNTAGEVACASAANIFWITQDRLFTPALNCGVLDGIMRDQVLRQAALMGVLIIEAHEGTETLARADAVFLTNSLIGLRPVTRIDRRPYGSHPLVARLAQACAEAAS